jgi:predicted Zn-dependent protease
MAIPTPIEVIQVLLLFDEEHSREYGLALWAALHEVEAFYNRTEPGRRGKPGAAEQPRMNVRRLYISPYVPSPSLLNATFRMLFKAGDTQSALELLSQEERAKPEFVEAEIVAPDERTYDQNKLVETTRRNVLRNRFGQSGETAHLMIVTDKPITPPPEWRYIIWSFVPIKELRSAVISTAPLDPGYWGDSDPNRTAIIKDRVRTAAMCISGRFLGLHRCGDPRCFMYGKVDSVTYLDQMHRLGKEHEAEIDGLTGRGFRRLVTDPTIVQEDQQISPGT